ncbi:MAG TPA: polysaccharide deacetylase family protein [Bryobacteraceae bacterium]|nr:polysaccharide deacetylase family protein [Bryobacteraceae bacterium]
MTPAVVPFLETGAAALCAGAAVLAYGVRAPSSSLFAPSIYKGIGTRRAIALTFDDGPSESTSELLEILAAHGAPATFFQCGANVRRLPEVARQVAAAGHEIGNHTDTHPMLHFKSRNFIYRELAAAQETIEQITAVRPSLFRAPFGVRWFGLGDAQRRLGLHGVMWSTLALDWKWPRDRVVSRLLAGAWNGAIFCLHDGRKLQSRPDVGVTLETVRELLPKLMERGFHFERVTEILCPTKN